MADPKSRETTLQLVDQVCDQFEKDWLDGHKPILKDYLVDASESHQSELFSALVRVEIELRRRERRSVRRVDYLRRFPQFHHEIVQIFELEDSPESDNDQAFAGSSKTDEEAVESEPIILKVVAGPRSGKQFVFDQHDTFLVGRSKHAHLQLRGDPHFSRFHFRLEVNPPVCHLIDLGSRNGTFVNGKPVRECSLKAGDLISGGKTELKILSGRCRPRSTPATNGPQRPVNSNVPQLAPEIIPEPAHRHASKSSPVSNSVAGAEIPGYELLETLRQGDNEIVYKAIRKSTGRTCSLKVLTPAVPASDKSLQMFLRECQIHGQLNHPRIVKLLDQGVSHHGRLYLATEYVPSISLAEHLAQRSVSARVRICSGLMAHILGALQYAHARSLVHRDIKPGTILVTHVNRRLSARLADFGVAKSFLDAGLSQITRAGDVVGSLPFIAPEQFVNSREARPSCDLYSVGATLYQWLSGSFSHDFPKGRSPFLVILEDAPVPISKRLPGISASMSTFFQRALARNPADRFLSAEEMRRALLSAQEQISSEPAD